MWKGREPSRMGQPRGLENLPNN